MWGKTHTLSTDTFWLLENLAKNHFIQLILVGGRNQIRESPESESSFTLWRQTLFGCLKTWLKIIPYS